MTMFSSDHRNFFIVQSGIAALEEIKPIADWRWKTVTLYAERIDMLPNLLSAVIRPTPNNSVFYFHIAKLPTDSGETQRYVLKKALQNSPPGFGEVHITPSGDKMFALARLINIDRLDLRYISSYRSTILLKIGTKVNSAAKLWETLSPAVGDLRDRDLARLLELIPTLTVVRVLELESCVVAQLMSGPDIAIQAMEAFGSSGAHQVHDLSTIPTRIQRL